MRRDIDDRTPIRLKASRPSDLVGLVPYLLGFRPTDSLVVVYLRDGKVVLTGRLDLHDTWASDAYVDLIRRLAGRHRADGLLVLIYTDASWGLDLAVGLGCALEADGLFEALHVGTERWWSATCDGSCCPPEGTPYDLTSHPLSAAAVLAGMNALPERALMLDWVRGPDPALLPSLERAVLEARVLVEGLSPQRRGRLLGRLVREQVTGPKALDDVDCALFAVLAEDVRSRDVAWAAITRRHANDHVALWRQVVARTPDALASGPICLLGMAAWVSGNGALQNLCIDRMLEVDPGYTMTGLLVDINESSTSPEIWDSFAKGLRRELRRSGGPS